MGLRRVLRSLLRASVVAAMLAAGPAAAQDSTSIDAVLARLASDPATPDAYSASVALHVKLRVFPFISLTLHGDSSFKRPGLYHFVFRGLPKAADKFNDLRYDLGDPGSWAQRYDLSFAPESTADAPVLRLTPKTPGQVAHLDVQTDATSGRIFKAVWSRHDGGTITLVQKYVPLGNEQIVAEQHATIDIPHMRAELIASYADFTLDVPTVAGVSPR
jgi:hypothetical protein